MPKPEKVAERKFVSHVENDGGFAIKMNLHGRRGWPDRLVVFPNGSFFIEFKREDTGLEPLQDHIHKQIRSLGYAVYTAHNFEQAEQAYNKEKRNVEANQTA